LKIDRQIDYLSYQRPGIAAFNFTTKNTRT
jgi:hypothetical protein